MIIQTSADWRIAPDPLHWHLERRRPKSGRFVPLAYFGDFDRALAEAGRRRILAKPGLYTEQPWNRSHPA